MLTALGNGEELRHLNRQEDWLRTVVVFGIELLKHNNMPMTLNIEITTTVPLYCF